MTSHTSAPADASPGAAPGRRAGRGPAAMLLLLLAALTAVSAVPVWLRSTGASALEGAVPVDVTGTQAAPGVVAAAVVLLAAMGATGLVGRAGRWVVVAVVALAGAIVLASTVGALTDSAGIAEAAAAELTGVSALAAPVRPTLWPWAALVVGVADLGGAALLAVMSRAWPSPTRRHSAPGAAGPVAARVEPDDDQAAWDSLTRGDDPT